MYFNLFLFSPSFFFIQEADILFDVSFDDDNIDADYVPDSSVEYSSDNDFIPIGIKYLVSKDKQSSNIQNTIGLCTDILKQNNSLEQFENTPIPDLEYNESDTQSECRPISPEYFYPEEGSSKNQKRQHKTKLDKRHFCPFCEQSFTKLKRHLLRKHQDEREMFSFLSATKEDKITEFKKLRNAGDHLHNIKVLKSGQGEIVTQRKLKNNESDSNQFVPCSICLGYFYKRDLWRHKCVTKNKIPKRQLVRSGQLLLPSNVENEGLAAIFSSLRADNTSIIAKSDSLIKLYAEREFQKNGHDKDRHPHIRNKIKELARLLLALREKNKQQ